MAEGVIIKDKKPSLWGPEVATTDGWGPEVAPGGGDAAVSASTPAPPADVHFEAQKPSLWERANTGLISGDQITKGLTGLVANDPRNGGGLQKLDQKDLARERDLLDPNETPSDAAIRTAIAGAGHDSSDLLSGFTSPLSIATLGLGSLVKGGGVLAKVAKPLLTASGIGFGIKGASDVTHGIDEGLATPQGSQKALFGASQIAGAVEPVRDTYQGAKVLAGKVIPTAFATGEPAIIKALSPSKKDTPFVRRAIQRVAPELQKANISSLEDAQHFASRKRNEVADEVSNRLSLSSPNAPAIDPAAVKAQIEAQINPLMQLESTITQIPGPQTANPSKMNTNIQLSPNGRAIQRYASLVSDSLARNPIKLTEAEHLVQYINAEISEFERLAPADKRAAIASGDPIIAKKALKNALQTQIEQHVNKYKDLKEQYGAYKEIQNAVENKMNDLDRKPTVSWMSRHAAEAAGAGLGTILGAGHANPIAGGAAGYLMGKALTDAYIEHRSSPDSLISRGTSGLNRVPPVIRYGMTLPTIQAGVNSAEQAINKDLTPIHRAVKPPAEPKIRVKHPDGTLGSIPKSDLDAALSQGYTVVGGKR